MVSNYNKLQKNKTINFLILVIFFLFFLINFNNYEENKLTFFFYNFVSFLLLILLVNIQLSAFEVFLYTFFLLSFYFKFNFILLFENIDVTEGDYTKKNLNYNLSTLIITLVFATCIITSLLKDFLLPKTKYPKKKFKKKFQTFYIQKRKLIFISLCFLLLLFWLSNLVFGIYAKGIVNNNLPSYIISIYAWMHTYALSVFISIFVYVDYLIFKNRLIIFFGFFETFISNIVILSRGFIFTSIAYFRGFYQILPNKAKISKFLNLKFLLIFLVLFVLSFVAIFNLRNTQFNKNEIEQKNFLIIDSLRELRDLSINRWVGIDALLSVSTSKNLSFSFFVSAFNEKKKIREKSFYINNFFKKFEYSKDEKDNLNIVITPGIIAFLFYSGSISFLICSLTFIILFCVMIERLFFYISSGNFILTNIIGLALSYRLIHFGYLPNNTALFLLSFVVCAILVYIFSKIIWK